MIVTNASPLIVLGKQSKLDLLRRCFSRVLVPESVCKEVLMREDVPEAVALQKCIGEGWMRSAAATIHPLLATERLGQGEKEAISVAFGKRLPLLIDDELAKRYASALGVQAYGTLYVLFRSVREGFIAKEKAKALLQQMVAGGFCLSADVYGGFLERLEGL